MKSKYPNVKKSDKTFPGRVDEKTGSGEYPVNTKARARAALGFVGMHGSPAEKKAVRAKVASKYPDLGKKYLNPLG